MTKIPDGADTTRKRRPFVAFDREAWVAVWTDLPEGPAALFFRLCEYARANDGGLIQGSVRELAAALGRPHSTFERQFGVLVSRGYVA